MIQLINAGALGFQIWIAQAMGSAVSMVATMSVSWAITRLTTETSITTCITTTTMSIPSATTSHPTQSIWCQAQFIFHMRQFTEMIQMAFWTSDMTRPFPIMDSFFQEYLGPIFLKVESQNTHQVTLFPLWGWSTMCSTKLLNMSFQAMMWAWLKINTFCLLKHTQTCQMNPCYTWNHPIRNTNLLNAPILTSSP